MTDEPACSRSDQPKDDLGKLRHAGTVAQERQAADRREADGNRDDPKRPATAADANGV